MAFAKIFERPGFGQVLVRIAQSPQGHPGVSWAVEPPGFGVCEFGIWARDSEDGEATAQKWIESADEAKADLAAGQIFKACGIDV